MCRCRGYSGRRGRSIRHHLPSGLSIASRPRCGAACRSDSRILWVRFSPAKFPRSPMSRRYRSRWPKSVTCVALTIALACTSDERVESPPRNITSTTTTTTPSQVLVGAGNIANCGTLNDDATAALIDNVPGTVYTTGDNIYGDGSLTDFQNCYGPSWGRHKARTRPAVGHKDYQAAGAAGATNGIRQFTVGTGGSTIDTFGTPIANSEVRATNLFGVLKLTLADGSYSWQFIPIAGQTFTDSGSGSCH